MRQERMHSLMPIIRWLSEYSPLRRKYWLPRLIHHEAAALHPDGVAAVEVGVKVGTVAHALMVPTLEMSVLVEYDL